MSDSSNSKMKASGQIGKNSTVAGNQLIGVKEIFVDGVFGAMIGAAVSKIVFKSILDMDDNGKELAEPTLRLSIPTQALLGFCVQTRESREKRRGKFGCPTTAAISAADSPACHHTHSNCAACQVNN
jgi:hypothetical protein